MPVLDQSVELQEFLRHEYSQVIMPTADSFASKEVVTAALLVIGGKILADRTKDQNIGYIAEYLTAIGIDLKEVRVVGDEERAIVDTQSMRSGIAAPIVFAGSGRPTVTSPPTVAKAFGVPIDSDPPARHPARMGEDDWRRDERSAPAPDAHPQGRGSHPQQSVRGAWAFGSPAGDRELSVLRSAARVQYK